MSNQGEGLVPSKGSYIHHEPVRPGDPVRDVDSTRFAIDLTQVIDDRLSRARVIRVLSDRNGKLLTHEIEPDGKEFVRRQYTRGGVSDVTMTNLNTYSFETAWIAMQQILSEAELPMVQSVLLMASDDSALILSSFIPDLQSVLTASTATKKIFAERLSKCCLGTISGAIAEQVINADGFAVIGEAGQDEITLIDVDPCIGHPLRDFRNPDYAIKRMSELFWEEWCTEDEREEVLTHLTYVVNRMLTDEQLENPRIFEALSDLHSMSTGLDSRRKS